MSLDHFDNTLQDIFSEVSVLTVYLDSQDYSVLTDPKRKTPELVEIDRALKAFKSSGKVKFVFSAVTVSENVATTYEASLLALRKGELLSELCGANALISLDRILELEICSLRDRTVPSSDVIDQFGNWFPNIPKISVSDKSGNMLQVFLEEHWIQDGLSRAERRVRKREFFKNGRPREKLKRLLDERYMSGCVELLRQQFPMKIESAETITKFLLGSVHESDFEDAVFDSMRDPKFMMHWFTTEFSLTSPIAEMVRAPGREIGEQFRRLIEFSIARMEAHSDFVSHKGKIIESWRSGMEFTLLSIIRRAADEKNTGIVNFDLEGIEMFCPGVTSVVKSLFSSAWENVGGSRKKLLEDSQLVDAMHAMYAPYVDVFRADRFMSPHIQKHVKSRGTIVVPTLDKLIDVIEKNLR